MKHDYNRNDTFVLTSTDGVRQPGTIIKFGKQGKIGIRGNYFYCTEGFKVLYEWCKPTFKTRMKCLIRIKNLW